MAIEYKVTKTLQLTNSIGISSQQNQVTYSNEGEKNIDVTIAASQTNKQVAWTCDVSQSKVLYIVSDKDCTVKTNSSGSPQETIALVANKPLLWDADCYLDHPLSGDVTTLYVTTTDETRLKIFSLEDATP